MTMVLMSHVLKKRSSSMPSLFTTVVSSLALTSSLISRSHSFQRSLLLTTSTRILRNHCIRALSESSEDSMSSSSSSKPFAINVRFKVKPECRDDFLRAMKNNVYGTLTKEPNSLQFELGEDIDEPNVFYIHEEYKSLNDHRSFHRTMQHYKDCIELFNDESNNPFLVPNKVDEFYLSHDGPSSKILPTTKEGEDTPPTTKRLCLNAQLNIKPEVRDEFLQVIENLKVGGDTIEEKCLQFTWGESLEIPNQFHVHEQYIGEADGLQGYEEHLQTPHVAARDEFTATKKPFTKPPIIEKYYSIV